jgi:hypothetical protein
MQDFHGALSNNAVHNSISNVIFDFQVVYNRPVEH